MVISHDLGLLARPALEPEDRLRGSVHVQDPPVLAHGEVREDVDRLRDLDLLVPKAGHHLLDKPPPRRPPARPTTDRTDRRLPLRQAGLLTRDPRMKERKKYGLKRARKAPQYTKR